MDLSGASPISSQSPSLKYSEQAGTLAKALIQSATLQGQPEAVDNLLLSGLELIEKSPETTDDEKMLARLIIPIDTKNVSLSSASKARLCVLNAIANSVPGPAGAVISKVAIDSSRDLEYYPDRNAITTKGLKAISQHQGATPLEQTFAGFASGFTNSAFSVTMVDHAQTNALSAFGTALAGSPGALCGSFALKTAADFTRTGSAYGESALHHGLKYFYDGTSSTPGQKSLAYHGFVRHRDDDIPYAVKNTFLTALSSTSSEALPNILAKTSLEGVKELDRDEQKNFFLFWSLKTIDENPDSSEMQKILANDGIALYTAKAEAKTETESLMSAQTALLETIASLPTDADGGAGIDALRALKDRLGGLSGLNSLKTLSDLEAAAHNAAEPSSSNVESDDDFIYIDGLRLQKHRFISMDGLEYIGRK